MRPYAYGSSTMGVKKSTVATMARSAVSLMTAASSRVEASTRIRGSVASGTWRKTCASSAGPSLQAQPAPCEKRVNRIAVMGAVDIGSTEDTLSESPGENGAGEDVARDGRNKSAHAMSAQHQARQCLQQAEQQEDQPPAAVTEGIEPQRSEQRQHDRLRQGDRRRRSGSDRLDREPRFEPVARSHQPHRHRQPREDEPPERHRLPRRSGGTYPGPRSPRPGRAAASLP